MNTYYNYSTLSRENVPTNNSKTTNLSEVLTKAGLSKNEITVVKRDFKLFGIDLLTFTSECRPLKLIRSKHNSEMLKFSHNALYKIINLLTFLDIFNEGIKENKVDYFFTDYSEFYLSEYLGRNFIIILDKIDNLTVNKRCFNMNGDLLTKVQDSLTSNGILNREGVNYTIKYRDNDIIHFVAYTKSKITNIHSRSANNKSIYQHSQQSNIESVEDVSNLSNISNEQNLPTISYEQSLPTILNEANVSNVSSVQNVSNADSLTTIPNIIKTSLKMNSHKINTHEKVNNKDSENKNLWLWLAKIFNLKRWYLYTYVTVVGAWQNLCVYTNVAVAGVLRNLSNIQSKPYIGWLIKQSKTLTFSYIGWLIKQSKTLPTSYNIIKSKFKIFHLNRLYLWWVNLLKIKNQSYVSLLTSQTKNSPNWYNIIISKFIIWFLTIPFFIAGGFFEASLLGWFINNPENWITPEITLQSAETGRELYKDVSNRESNLPIILFGAVVLAVVIYIGWKHDLFSYLIPWRKLSTGDGGKNTEDLTKNSVDLTKDYDVEYIKAVVADCNHTLDPIPHTESDLLFSKLVCPTSKEIAKYKAKYEEMAKLSEKIADEKIAECQQMLEMKDKLVRDTIAEYERMAQINDKAASDTIIDYMRRTQETEKIAIDKIAEYKERMEVSEKVASNKIAEYNQILREETEGFKRIISEKIESEKIANAKIAELKNKMETSVNKLVDKLVEVVEEDGEHYLDVTSSDEVFLKCTADEEAINRFSEFYDETVNLHNSIIDRLDALDDVDSQTIPEWVWDYFDELLDAFNNAFDWLNLVNF